jgi:hypothetical protein
LQRPESVIQPCSSIAACKRLFSRPFSVKHAAHTPVGSTLSELLGCQPS